MNLLLLSNSSSDAGYLAHALPDIRELIATLPAGAPAVFVPYAGVTRNWDDYTAMVVTALADTGLDIEPLHRAADPVPRWKRPPSSSSAAATLSTCWASCAARAC